jgi:hypothetical protein
VRATAVCGMVQTAGWLSGGDAGRCSDVHELAPFRKWAVRAVRRGGPSLDSVGRRPVHGILVTAEHEADSDSGMETVVLRHPLLDRRVHAMCTSAAECCTSRYVWAIRRKPSASGRRSLTRRDDTWRDGSRMPPEHEAAPWIRPTSGTSEWAKLETGRSTDRCSTAQWVDHIMDHQSGGNERKTAV